MTKILEVTDATFDDEVLNSEQPVMVDFWAEWCAPCRVLSPLIEQLAETYGDRLRVAKVNVDENPNIVAKLSIRAMPTLLFIKDGQVTDSLVGVQPKGTLSQHIDRLLGS